MFNTSSSCLSVSTHNVCLSDLPEQIGEILLYSNSTNKCSTVQKKKNFAPTAKQYYIQLLLPTALSIIQLQKKKNMPTTRIAITVMPFFCFKAGMMAFYSFLSLSLFQLSYLSHVFFRKVRLLLALFIYTYRTLTFIKLVWQFFFFFFLRITRLLSFPNSSN